MACVAHELLSAAQPGHGCIKIPVIADNGSEAFVVVVPFKAKPRLGDRFNLDGTVWEIVREKDHLRGYVAAPRDRRF